MKNIFITFLLAIFIGFNISGQTTYFNNHFSYNNRSSTAMGIVQSNNDYIIIGLGVNPISPSRVIAFWKMDLNGIIQFTKIYGDSNVNYWAGDYNCAHKNISGDITLASTIEYPVIDSSILVFYKFNHNGDTVLFRNYDSSYGTGISQYVAFDNHTETLDFEYILIGRIYLPGSYNQGILVVRTDSLGNELWRKVISTNNRVDIAYNIINTPDSGFVIGAYQYWAGVDFTGNPRVYKLDKQGNLEWTRTYGSQWDDCAARVILTRDTNILVVYGEAYMLDEPGDPATALPEVAIVKVSLTGQQIWKRNYRQYHTSIPNAVTLGHDGYVIAGWTFMSDTITGDYGEMGFVLKINDNGDSIWWRNHWNQPIMSNMYEQNKLYDITATSDGGYIACGETSSAFTPGTLGYQHGWVLKMDSLGCDTPGCHLISIEERILSIQELEVFPNPFEDEMHIVLPEEFGGGMLVLYDVNGCKALETRIQTSLTGQAVAIQTGCLRPGMYLLEISGKDGRIWRRKVMTGLEQLT